MQYYDEMTVKVLHVTEELDVPGIAGEAVELLPMPDVTLPYIPQSGDYPVTGLKGLREQFDMLLAALKAMGLMESSNKEGGS